MKVREGGRVIKIAVMVATGVNADGFREILGVATSTAESGAGWNSFFKDLVARGLSLSRFLCKRSVPCRLISLTGGG
jgi:transposase-like protein